MKVWKKNVTAAAVLVVVCAGIYLNWMYTEGSEPVSLSDTLDPEKVMDDSLLVMSTEDAQLTAAEDLSATDTATDYFAAVRLSRQEARDSAVNLLQEAMAYDTASEQTSHELEELVEVALSEAQIESLVVAKGYADCVAYMSGDGISVAVAAPETGLQQTDVAVITDIILTQSDYDVEDIRIVEVQ
ncbi:MAG: SpoIIIAH-like family protein [Oscillospiraceae bacterium]|nr:SpoIIIAH-like family protein [Oscillospiraceae bacterium]